MNTNLLTALETALETDAIKLVLPTIQDIKTAFDTVSANPGNAVVLAEQEAVVVAKVNQLMTQAPVLLPILQSEGISVGAVTASGLLEQVIAKLQGLIAPAPVTGVTA